MNSEPNHQSVCGRLGELCAKSIEDVEKALTAQREAEAATVRLREEEERAKKERERMATEQAEKEKVERARKMEEERNAIAAAAKELAIKRQILRDWEKANGEEEDMQEDDNEGSEVSGSPVDQPTVSKAYCVIIFYWLTGYTVENKARTWSGYAPKASTDHPRQGK